jgi:hypothetical protein
MLICAECGAEFQTSRGRQKYCSPKCSREVETKRLIAHEEAHPRNTKQLQQCSTPEKIRLIKN